MYSEYNTHKALEIEKKYQDRWKQNPYRSIYNPNNNKTMFILDMFSYPSGYGLHVGHLVGYIATDVIARLKRSEGFNLLYTMGFDTFGLPAEQYSIENKVHPTINIEENIRHYKKQLMSVGLSYDWSRSIKTSDKDFYKWTQWIFIKMFNSYYDDEKRKAVDIKELIDKLNKSQEEYSDYDNRRWNQLSELEKDAILNNYRLAYRKSEYVNWCPKLSTVLADEEIGEDNLSIKGSYPIVRVLLEQWYLRITKYADRLLDGLSNLDWPKRIKKNQINWIGRKEVYKVNGTLNDKNINLLTSSLDNLNNISFISTSYKNKEINSILKEWDKETKEEWKLNSSSASKALEKFLKMLDNHSNNTYGFFTGTYIHLENQQIPLFIIDSSKELDNDLYYLHSNNIDIDMPYIELFHIDESISIKKESIRSRKIDIYKLHDWLFSRQRFWGEPIPIIYDKNQLPIPLDESTLPLEVPDIDFQSFIEDDDTSSNNVKFGLEKADDDWKRIKINDEIFKREMNTMPQWAGSSFYYLRYMDPLNKTELINKDLYKYWMKDGIDLYVGGVEHSVSHLLYSRFYHMFLYDINVVTSKEPFKKLRNQGYVETYAYRRNNGEYIDIRKSNVIEKNNKFYYKIDNSEEELKVSYGKMGKSLKNSVDPLEIINEYGADTLRIYILSLAPLETNREWSLSGIQGSYRFLKRIWKTFMISTIEDTDLEDKTLLFNFLSNYNNDINNMKFNTAISEIIKLYNNISNKDRINKTYAIILLKSLYPFAPHISLELAESLFNINIETVEMPIIKNIKDDIINVKVHINNKYVTTIQYNKELSEEELKDYIYKDNKVNNLLTDKEIRNIIDRLPNFINFITN